MSEGVKGQHTACGAKNECAENRCKKEKPPSRRLLRLRLRLRISFTLSGSKGETFHRAAYGLKSEVCEYAREVCRSNHAARDSGNGGVL